MSVITVLHLSDLHWNTSNAADLRIVVEALCTDLHLLRTEEGIVPDLIIFSGDLVRAGEVPVDFVDARISFINQILEATGLAGDRLFVAPGNHDIARSIVRENQILETGLLSSLISTDAVNRFIEELQAGKQVNDLSVNRLRHFNDFIQELDGTRAITNSPVLRTFIVEISGEKVGIACFNTAWRATGEADNVDRHSLLLGERNVDIAMANLDQATLRLAVFHHPLDWLAEFDEIAVASRLYTGFDVLLFGHTHRAFPEGRITPVGSSILSQAGCLYQSRDYFNGYQFLRIDILGGTAEFIIRTYNDSPRRAFDKALNIAPDGRLALPFISRAATPSLSRVERVLRRARPIIRHAATEQIAISDTEPSARPDIKDAFVCPPLQPGRLRAVPVVAGDIRVEDEITPEMLLRETGHLFVVGPRECGKSSLAHYMAVLCAEGIIDRPRIPIVVDYRQLRKNTYGLKRAIATYLSDANQGLDTDTALRDGDFVLLVDNFVVQTKTERAEFKSLIDQQPSCRWICFADHSFGLTNADYEAELPTDFRVILIQQLPRRAIRELSRRWCDQIGRDSDQIFTTVMNQLRRDSLPRNGYIVTLLLWAVYQERNFERVNEAVLLTNIVDFLLGKADFQQALRREFDPTSKEITLQSLASFIRSRGGFVSVNDVTEYLIAFFRQKGLDYSATDILSKLIECGILHRSGDDVTFKYRCFEEYFLACLFRDDETERAKALAELHFIGYARELDLLSGLRRRNTDLITIVSDAVDRLAPAEIGRQDLEDFNNIAKTESELGLGRRKIQEIKTKKITSEQIDDLMDKTDRRLTDKGRSRLRTDSDATAKANGDHSVTLASDGRLPIWTFLESLDLLGRIVRNSEFNDADEKESATRLYIRSCAKCVLVICEALSEVLDVLRKEGSKLSVELSAEEIDGVSYILNNAVFIGFQELMVNGFATEKLAPIYEMILDDTKISSVERLLLSMILLDLRISRWPSHWEAMIEANAKRRFVLDILTDKIWRLIHTRPLPDTERDRLTALVVRIEEKLGAPKRAKSSIIANIRKRAAETTRREG